MRNCLSCGGWCFGDRRVCPECYFYTKRVLNRKRRRFMELNRDDRARALVLADIFTNGPRGLESMVGWLMKKTGLKDQGCRAKLAMMLREDIICRTESGLKLTDKGMSEAMGLAIVKTTTLRD